MTSDLASAIGILARFGHYGDVKRSDEDTGRRDFLRKGSFLALAAGTVGLSSVVKDTPAAVVNYDLFGKLSQGQALAGRMLLVFDLCVTRFKHHAEFPLPLISETAELFKEHIQLRCTRLEEEYLFPLIHTDSRKISVLRDQHRAAGALLEQLLENAGSKEGKTKNGRIKTAALLSDLVIMYRPHIFHETSYLFPAFAAKADERTKEEWLKQCDRFLPQTICSSALTRLETIEQQCGLLELEHFTPQWYRYNKKPAYQLTSAE